jgi:predicted HTH transcriptional regulator
MLDTPQELLRKIRLGEDTSLELKTVLFKRGRVVAPKRDDLAAEITALANSAGGLLVLGVEDKTKEIVGIPVDLLEAVDRFVFEICEDSIDPPVAYHAYRLELPDSTGTLRAVLKVEVPRSLFVHKSPGGYFRRQGSSKREMPPDVLARLFQQRSQARLIRFDEQTVPETRPADLDEALWRRFIGSRSDDPLSTLRKIGLLREDDTGTERATVAGVLMCSTTPHRWLPGTLVTAVRYRGTRPDSNYQMDASDIEGPLDLQVRDTLAFARRNTTVSARKTPGRVEIPQFSERAVFEAVVNAIAHRDYSIHGSKIRLLIFDDRLELYSPGTLPNTVTIESMALRQATRNELITSLLARCPAPDSSPDLGRSFLMDKRGEGVPIINAESRRLSGRDPEYRLLDDAELMLTIWAAAVDSGEPASTSDQEEA